MSDYTKYNAMENTLQSINAHFISLSKEEIRRNNVILHEVIWKIVEKMRDLDPKFDKLFSTIFYGGSYYDGLKVGQPDEYDIDLLLLLPRNLCPEVTISTKPGFVHAKIANKDEFGFLCEPGTNYLDTERILSWIHGLLQKALNYHGGFNEGHDFHVSTFRRGGPAFTLNISGIRDPKFHVDIDLVTCISFRKESWPQGGYRENPCRDKETFFIVPKSPKSLFYHKTRFWRLSFQAQERYLIQGKEKLKPALRLLKKMRNYLDQPIDSYHLKTIVLWEAFQNPSVVSSDKSLSFVFMHILKLYQQKILAKKIEYFWNKKLNLIENFHDDTYINIGLYLGRIIKKIENDPPTVVNYILDHDELEEFENSPQLLIPPPEENSCIIL